MGQRTRHFMALMKKNWIVWKRTLGASLCELFCPVVLMVIIVIARLLIKKNTIGASSNLKNSVLMAPMVSNITFNSDQDIIAALGSYQQQYGAFTNFTQTNLAQNNLLNLFRPYHCKKNIFGIGQPLVGVAGPAQYTDPLKKDLTSLFQLQKQIQNQTLQDERTRQFLEQNGFADIGLDLSVRSFDSSEAVMKYLKSPDYQQNAENQGLCFAVSITENTPDDIEVRLFFSGEAQDPVTQSIPSQLNPAWSEFDINADFQSFNKYTTKGYSLMHNWVANSILRAKSGFKNASIALTLVPFKTDDYISDDFTIIMSGLLPFFLLLVYILPMYRLISNIVSEKETKARESMKMMGLTDFSYWLSWWVYYVIIVTIISALVILVLSFNVFTYSNRGLIFLYIWIFGLSLFGLAVFLSAFFSKARVAAISGTLVYFGTSFVDVAVADPSVKMANKGLASLLTTVAISRGSEVLGKYETTGVGVQSFNLQTPFQNYSLGASMIIMVISLVLFLFIGLYLDNVLPSAYGLRKQWFYCLKPSFWCGQKRRNISRKESPRNSVDIESKHDQVALDPYFEQKQMNPNNFEPVSRELLKQETDNKILKVQGLEKIFENGFQAVRGVDMRMYNGQIFALLGHNGAGKTTTISMLTGLISSSQGSAKIFENDLFEQMDEVRHYLGVCPQHDILFDLLTPEEHLDIFCDFKGVNSVNKREEIKKMLIDVDVYNHKDTVAGNLSGGSRRKLSVAIALIGGSKLVLLDEPTAGMDLSARRKLWNMLKNYKHNRIIILTTHYMDEADILGDRIGIMTGGKLICLGSSLFLKNRFGVGYNLTMVKNSKEKNLQVGPYLIQNLGSEVKLLSEVSSEITYQIPNALSVRFKDFFNQFDNALDSIGIKSYGISVTTLEEVFLKVGHGDDTNDDFQKKKELMSAQQKHEDEGHQSPDKQLLDKEEDDYSIADPKYHVSTLAGFFLHVQALFLKRFFIYRRNRKGLIVEVFIPVLLVLIGFAFSKVQFFINQNERPLSPNLYPVKQRIIANQDQFITTPNLTDPSNLSPMSIFEQLPLYQSNFDITYKTYTGFNKSDWKSSQKLAMTFDNDTFNNRLVNGIYPYRFGGYYIYEANNATKQFKTASFINLTSQDVTAAYPQFLYEATLKKALNKPNLKFNVVTQPYPITEYLRLRAASGSGFFISFVVSIGFALIPSVVVSFILNEREKNLKHMQLISGMSLSAYWVSNLIFDIAKGLTPSIIVIGLMYAFGLNYPNTWLLFLLYPVGVIPFTYVMSFFFASENVAQTITIFLHFVFAGIGAIVVFVLKIIPSTKSVGDILGWVLKVVPSFCLTDTIMFDAGKKRLFLVRPDLKRDSDWDIDLVGGNVLVLCLHFIFWLLVLVLIERGWFEWTGKILNLLSKNSIPPKDVESLNLDDDVLAEESRIENLSNQEKRDMKIRVHGFRKIYPSLFRDSIVAVERTSFGLEYGECFALLGINGAGKSTTFKALTCEIEPTKGEITISGYDAQREFSKARKLIGYCPQHDAIFELMTVEEHLEYYARIKGIPDRLRKNMIEKQIVEMNLAEHRKKPAGTLSGGNKRKLSVAMAIIGNPPILLLDEPSAGMDPEARRFMWSIVARISQQRKKSAVILTTHSMEEAEALSTKMAIMVTGGIFRCFGSSQQIKNKFGTGYEIEVKVRKFPEEDLKKMAIQYGQGENCNEGAVQSLESLKEALKSQVSDQFLLNEIREGGLGGDLVKEAEEQDGNVSVQNFLTWIYIEQAGIQIINGLCEQFPQVEILEHYNDYYKMRIPRGDKSIGYVFGLIEGQKEQFKISEYSVSQTTLEQIFQTFANLKIDDDSIRKLLFKKDAKTSRAQLYHPDKQESIKRQFSKTKMGEFNTKIQEA